MTTLAAPATAAPLMIRRMGNPGTDAVLRATAVVGLVSIPIVAFVPAAAPLIPLALTALWMRGPLSGLIPAGLEPVLMFYGALYSPWLVTLVAAAASAYAELVSQHVLRGVFGLRSLERVRTGIADSRIMRLFAQRPAVAIAITALSPVPDWITRSLAAVSRYPVARYVIADTIGRIPKLFIPAALGAVLHVPPGLLAAVTVGSVVGGAAIALVKWRRSRVANH